MIREPSPFALTWRAMRIGIDLDFTITDFPEFFSVVASALLRTGHEVHVITYRECGTRQGVIGELRENIGAEQMQNFVLAAEIVGDVLKPLQTCKICANWGPGCPDMLAISRAIVVSTLELMPELGQPELGQPELGAADSA